MTQRATEDVHGTAPLPPGPFNSNPSPEVGEREGFVLGRVGGI